jgi:sn-glycerol 3-phosphate transport system permease protein
VQLSSTVTTATERWTAARKRLTARKAKDLLTALVFLVPSTIVFVVFSYYGLFYNLYISLTSWDFVSPAKRFVGAANYERFIQSGMFGTVLRNTAVFSVTSTLAALVLGLGLALLLNRQVKGRGIARTILFSPYVTALSALAMLWSFMYEPRYGLVNQALGAIGIKGPTWIRSMQWAMPAIIIMDVWRTTGYNMVLYLAGLQGIPTELTEAARIDGASSWQVLRHITIPLLSPTTFFLIVVRIIASFKIFTAVSVMTSGGPLNATQVFTYYIYQQAFVYFKAGYAAAISTIFFVLLMVLTIIQLRLQRRWVHYY